MYRSTFAHLHTDYAPPTAGPNGCGSRERPYPWAGVRAAFARSKASAPSTASTRTASPSLNSPSSSFSASLSTNSR